MTKLASMDPALMEELSHRLRSPLTSLITYLSIMDMRLEKAALAGGAPPQLREYAELEAAALADALHMGRELDRLLSRQPAVSAPPTPSMSAPHPPSMGDRRFDRLWEAWDARLGAGGSRLDMIKGLTERELAELLAADAGAGRSLERNIVATELTNRLAKRDRPPADAVVAAMARLLARASHTSMDARRLVAESAQARAEGARHRAHAQARRAESAPRGAE